MSLSLSLFPLIPMKLNEKFLKTFLLTSLKSNISKKKVFSCFSACSHLVSWRQSNSIHIYIYGWYTKKTKRYVSVTCLLEGLVLHTCTHTYIYILQKEKQREKINDRFTRTENRYVCVRWTRWRECDLQSCAVRAMQRRVIEAYVIYFSTPPSVSLPLFLHTCSNTPTYVRQCNLHARAHTFSLFSLFFRSFSLLIIFSFFLYI